MIEEKRHKLERLVQARLEERENERKESTEQKRRGHSLMAEASHPDKFHVKGVDQHGEVIVMRCSELCNKCQSCTSTQVNKEEERRRKELLVKARLEEREVERKKAIEQRKREQANKKY